MRKLLLLVMVGMLGWQGYRYYGAGIHRSTLNDSQPQNRTGLARPAVAYQCDGRTHCSQMTSCAEATYFLRNCPDVKMDGNNDGVPCEQQWCRP